MSTPEPGTPRWKAGEATNELVRRGAAASRATTAEQRVIAVRETLEQARVTLKAWEVAANAEQVAFEQERHGETP